MQNGIGDEIGFLVTPEKLLSYFFTLWMLFPFCLQVLSVTSYLLTFKINSDKSFT